MPAITVEQLTVNYDRHPVLWDIHVEIPTGIMVAVVGPNGAGKSTLLKAMLGIVKPVSGDIRFLGRGLNDVRHQIAYVPQRASVDWSFPITAGELVMMGLYGKMGLFRRAKAADWAAMRRVLKVVGMESFEEKQISELSGGQQQRLFIARALLQEAQIFLLDEPFAGVDMRTESELLELMQTLKKEGKTLMIVHHDLTTVQSYFDWALLLNTCLVACGPIEEVFDQEKIFRTFGKSGSLLQEVTRLSEDDRR